MSRLHIAVVREQLEDREVANWVPLSTDHDVVLVTRPTSGPYTASGLGLPIVTSANRLDRVPGALARRIVNRAAHRFDLERLTDISAMERADCVVVNETHIASAAQACELRARRPDLRVISVCYENIPFRYEDDPTMARRKDLCREHVDLFVALTPEARTALIVEGVSSERIVVQPYGVDPDRYSTAHRSATVRASWSLAADDIAVVFTGRLIQEKGLVELVRAVAAAGQRHPLRLIVVGSGPQGTRIDRAAATLGLRSVVRVPWVEANAIPAIVASADIFAMPSLPTPYWEEQLGFSAIEAMASSVAVLAVGSGSIPFVIGDGGRCAAPYDHASLVAELEALAGDPALRAACGAAGRQRVETVLNTATAGAALQEIVEQVVNR
jgi:glycosyltransferase involved in cell wall biosynthesis